MSYRVNQTASKPHVRVMTFVLIKSAAVKSSQIIPKSYRIKVPACMQKEAFQKAIRVGGSDIRVIFAPVLPQSERKLGLYLFRHVLLIIVWHIFG